MLAPIGILTPHSLGASVKKVRKPSGLRPLQHLRQLGEVRHHPPRLKRKATDKSLGRDHPYQRFHVVRWITMVKVSCRRHSQYKCQSRHKQDTKSHHNNWDGIISGNLEHRETPKIADPSLVPEMAEGGCSPLQGEKNDLLWLVKPTAKAKTVQNCSDRTSLGESADRRR